MSAPFPLRQLAVVALVAAALHGAAARGGGNSAPPLQEAIGTAAGQLAERAPGNARKCAVLPADGTGLSGYAAALLPVHLRQKGWDVRSIPWQRRSELPPGVPGSVNHRVTALAGKNRRTILVDCRRAPATDLWNLRIGLYGASDGNRLLLHTVGFSLSKDQSDLLSDHHNGLRGLQRNWYRLFREVSPHPPNGDDLSERLHRAEVRFFFRRGRWQTCVRRLKGVEPPGMPFVRRVMALHLAGNSDSAADLLESALSRQSGSGPLHLLKAWLVRGTDPERAARQIDEGRFADVEREGYYHFARALLALENKNYQKAEKTLLKSSDLLKQKAFVQIKTARFYWDRANLDKAIAYFRRAIDAGRRTAALRAELGAALAMAGKVEEAIEQLQAAASINPWRANVAQHLSSLFERRGQYSKAIDVLRRASEANLENPDFLCAYGDAAMHRWMLDEAVKAYRRALEADPGFPYARVRLARALARQNKYEKARTLLDRLMGGDNGKYVPAAVALGRLLTAQGRTDAAAKVLSEAAAESEAEQMRRRALAHLRLRTGNAQKAIRHAQIAASIGEDSRSYALLSRVFLEVGETSKAAVAAEKAGKANPYSARAHLALARVETHREKFEKALKHCKKALKLDPFLVDAIILKGTLHMHRDDPAGAARAWKQALKLDRWNRALHWRLAELLRSKCDKPSEAAQYYRRLAELGGPRQKKAAALADKLGKK